jgi:hypothetical protein
MQRDTFYEPSIACEWRGLVVFARPALKVLAAMQVDDTAEWL